MVIDLATRCAIADVVGLYCYAVDRRRWALMAQCFHDDGKLTMGTFDGSWREFVAAASAMLNPLTLTHHQLGQTIYMADGPTIVTESYFTAVHRVPADAPPSVFGGRGFEYDAVIGGRYLDRFDCNEGHWRISHRIDLFDWRHDLSPPASVTRTLAEDPFRKLIRPALEENTSVD